MSVFWLKYPCGGENSLIKIWNISLNFLYFFIDLNKYLYYPYCSQQLLSSKCR